MGEFAQLALVDGLEKIGRAVNAYLLLPLLPLPLLPLHLPLLHLDLIALFANIPARSAVECVTGSMDVRFSSNKVKKEKAAYLARRGT